MTTIAYKDGVLASDSRATAGGMIVSEKAEKLFNVHGYLVGIAGSAAEGVAFVSWLEKHVLSQQVSSDLPQIEVIMPEPSDDEDFYALVIFPDGRVFMYEGGSHCYPIQDDFYSIGSGSPFAMTAMSLGSSAIDAVQVAKKFDCYSGGEIKSLKTKEIQPDLTKDELLQLTSKEIIEYFLGEGE